MTSISPESSSAACTPAANASSLNDDLLALRRFVVDCPELRDLEKHLDRFNIFRVLRLQDHEIRHSNVLAWLLDPNENHGLGDMFLRRWLMRVFHDAAPNHPSYLDPVEIDSRPFLSVNIHREWAHVDLLVEITTNSNAKWVISIENKVWSTQHDNQLARYRDQVAAAFPEAKLHFIFLTIRDEAPEEGSYAIATYDQVREILETCLAELRGIVGDEPRLVIEHYIQIIRTHFMPNSEVEQLARRIYASHKQALDLILEYRPDIRRKLTEALSKRLETKQAELGLRVTGLISGVVYFLPESWRRTENRDAGGKQVVWMEVNFYNMRTITLKAVAGSTDAVWRQELFELSKRNKFQNTREKKTLTHTYHQFYGVSKAHALTDIEDGSIVDTVEVIVRWCFSQVGTAGFKKMVEVVAEHLGTHPKPPQV